MAFFSELTQKAKGVAAVAADKAKGAAEVTKLSVAISGEQREIEKNYRAIGEWFANEFEGEIPEGVKDLMQAVADSKAKIAEMEAAKAAARAEKPAAAASEKTCPICGVASDGRFCPQCGAPVDE
ncbi:MAG: zinc ribbon domain-containing protein [Ruminococcaceae bacterium]|nr:zinc ribbon domain-containing protein [Oscillospiraceae bacterium]